MLRYILIIWDKRRFGANWISFRANLKMNSFRKCLNSIELCQDTPNNISPIPKLTSWTSWTKHVQCLKMYLRVFFIVYTWDRYTHLLCTFWRNLYDTEVATSDWPSCFIVLLMWSSLASPYRIEESSTCTWWSCGVESMVLSCQPYKNQGDEIDLFGVILSYCLRGVELSR